MSRFRVGHIGSTALYVHAGAVLFAAYMFALGHGGLFLAGTVSILLHEGAHALCSALSGHPPGEVELTPLGAVMRLDDDARLPLFMRLCVVAAGPMCTGMLCWASVLLTKLDVLNASAGKMLFSANLAILFLNLLPAFPLDGGRLTAMLLDILLSIKVAARVMRWIGTVLGIVLIGCNIVLAYTLGGWNLSLAMVGCFILYAAWASTTSEAYQQLRRLMDRKIRLEQKGIQPCQWLAVTDRTPLRLAVACLPQRHYAMLYIMETGTMKPLAQATEEELVQLYLQAPADSCSLLHKDRREPSNMR